MGFDQSSVDEIDGEDITPSSATVEEVEATNETFVRTSRSASTGSTSAGTYANLYDVSPEDNRGEFNLSGDGRFAPDKAGKYLISAGCDVRGNTSSGDEMRMRVQNITDGTTVDRRFQTATGIAAIFSVTYIVVLDSSKEYEIQLTNQDSSFDVKSNIATKGQIVRLVVQ